MVRTTEGATVAISIGNIWDSTTDVLAGRSGMLAPVAALAFFLPAAVQAAVTSYGGTSPGVAGIGALVGIAALLATLWGQLTVVGIASDPDATREAAGRAALGRLGAAVLIALILVAITVLALVPVFAVLAATGFDFRAATAGAAGGGAPSVGPGAALFCLFYGLALLIGGLWLGARLWVWSAVVLHERRGIGALGRSIALTRGLTLKLIGVGLLLGIVYGIASLAARYVVFILFRLLLGPAQLATASWLGALAAGLVGAVFSTVVAVFTARLYAALVPAPPRFEAA